MKLWGDGAYDARYVFSLLQSLDISPLARVRTNSNTRSRGADRARSRAVLDQLGGRGGCTSYTAVDKFVMVAAHEPSMGSITNFVILT